MNVIVEESKSPFRSRYALVLALCAALLMSGAGCELSSFQESNRQTTKQQLKTTGAAYTEEVEQWKAKRLASLKGEDGWLSLVGLHWLKDGENRIGSDPSNEVVLPEGKSPRVAGSLFLNGGAVKIEA